MHTNAILCIILNHLHDLYHTISHVRNPPNVLKTRLCSRYRPAKLKHKPFLHLQPICPCLRGRLVLTGSLCREHLQYNGCDIVEDRQDMRDNGHQTSSLELRIVLGAINTQILYTWSIRRLCRESSRLKHFLRMSLFLQGLSVGLSTLQL